MPQLHACLSSVSSRLVLSLSLIAAFSTSLEADTTFAAVTTTSSTTTDSNRSAFPPSTATAEDTSAEGDAEEEEVPEGESGSTSSEVFDGIHAALVTLGVLSSASTASLERNTNAIGNIQDLAGGLAARTQAMRLGQGGSRQTCRAATLTSGTPLLKRPRDIQDLTAGTYSGSITVSDPAASSNPQTVSVSLILDPPPPSATLTWDANTESDLAGYRVYRSTTPGVYGAPTGNPVRQHNALSGYIALADHDLLLGGHGVRQFWKREREFQ